MPATRSGWRHTAAMSVMRSPDVFGCQDDIIRTASFELDKELVLEGQAFRHGFEHVLRIGQTVSQTWIHRDAVSRGLSPFGGDQSFLYEELPDGLDAGAGSIELLRLTSWSPDVVPGLGKAPAHPGAHGAGADHGGRCRLFLKCH